MRKYLAPVLCAMMMVGVAATSAGCKAQASLQAGGEKKPEPPPPPPAATPAPVEEAKPKKNLLKMGFKLQGNKLELPAGIAFETNSDKIKPESDEVLQIVNDFLAQRKDVTLMRIEGHTDSDGDDAKNQELSAKRAMAVARWLVAKGTDCKRLLPVGFGETKPVADNATAEGKAQNRRTEFHVAALNGKAVDKAPVDGGGKSAGDPCQ